MRFFNSVICVAFFCAVLAPLAAGQDFRIETEVFQGDATQPISENLTLFSGNLILDFMLPTNRSRFPEEIVIFQCREKEFVLLNTQNKTRTSILEGDVLRILATLQSSNAGNEKTEFIYHPNFRESFDPKSNKLMMESDQIIYEVQGERPNVDNSLPRYFEFISQFARLNATDPRRMPPFPRIKLNQAIKKYGIVPDVVKLTLLPRLDASTEPIELRTTHNVIWQLSTKDKKRVESAKRYWMEFEEVDLSTYRNRQQTVVAENPNSVDR